jgi:hypothetical protein
LLRFVALRCVLLQELDDMGMLIVLFLACMKEIFGSILPGGDKNNREPGRFFNFHVVVHTVEQVRQFGSLLIMNAARWETTHGRVKKLYRATRRATRTLQSCLSRATRNQDRAAWLLETTTEENKHHFNSSDEDEPGQNAAASSGEASLSEDDENHAEDRPWRPVGKVTPLNVQAEQGAVRAGKEPALAEFTFSRGVASEFWKSSFPDAKRNYPELLPEEADVSTIEVMNTVAYFGYNNETGAFDKEQVRCSQLFFNAPWQDGLQIIEAHPDAGKRRQHGHKRTIKNKATGTTIDLAYEPDAKRMFGIVNLIFACAGELFFLVEKLQGANQKRGAATWQNNFIPNWPHLRTLTGRGGSAPLALSSRLEVFPLSAVERVRIIVEDPNQSPDRAVRDYWCPMNEGCVPFDEVFYAGSRYKLPQTANDPDNNLEAELYVQPWELCPPSARSMASSARNRPYEHDAGDNLDVRNSGEQPEIEIQPNQDEEED